MAKELYLYSPLYNFVAEKLIAQMEESSGEDIVIRVNSPGGFVDAGWGLIAKMRERSGKTTMKVDGSAMSMAAITLLFADEVEALEVSTLMLHRADMYVENDEDQQYLDRVNKDIRAKMEMKINSDKMKEMTGFTIDDMFDSTKRINVHLSAKQAKAIGLVDKINKVNPKEVEAFTTKFYQAAAMADASQPSKQNPMTIEKLQSEHPEVYAQVFALGKKSGADEEFDRVQACLTFNDIDPKGVAVAVESRKPLSAKQMAEFTRKAVSAEAVKTLEGESQPAGATATSEAGTGTEKDKKATAIADFVKKVKEQTLNLK